MLEDPRGELLRRRRPRDELTQQTLAHALGGHDLVAAAEQVERDEPLQERERRVRELGVRRIRRERHEQPLHLAVQHDLATDEPGVAVLHEAHGRGGRRGRRPRLPRARRQARCVSRAGVPDRLAGAVEQKDGQGDQRSHLGEELVDGRVGDQQIQQVVLHGHRAPQPVQVAGGQGVVHVREHRADGHAPDLEDGQPELQGVLDHARRHSIDEVIHHDAQRGRVDGRDAIQ